MDPAGAVPPIEAEAEPQAQLDHIDQPPPGDDSDEDIDDVSIADDDNSSGEGMESFMQDGNWDGALSWDSGLGNLLIMGDAKNLVQFLRSGVTSLDGIRQIHETSSALDRAPPAHRPVIQWIEYTLESLKPRYARPSGITSTTNRCRSEMVEEKNEIKKDSSDDHLVDAPVESRLLDQFKAPGPLVGPSHLPIASNFPSLGPFAVLKVELPRTFAVLSGASRGSPTRRFSNVLSRARDVLLTMPSTLEGSVAELAIEVSIWV